MYLLRERLWFRGMIGALSVLLATVILVAGLRLVLPANKICPDFIQFWTAAKLLCAGESPYDVAGQARVQSEYGFDRATDGAGRYDFMPYYYPPWLGVLCVSLLPLGYATARLTWFVVLFESLLLSGYLLRGLAAGLPRWGTTLLTPLFAFSLLALLVGQVAPLMLFLMVAAWLLMEHGWDRSAGWILAGLMTKPHLGLAVVAAVLLWSIKQRRWRTVQGFLGGLAVLGAVSTCLAPDWPLQMLEAPTRIPLVTVERPWLSVTWYSLWQNVGLSGWMLRGAYALGVVLAAGLLISSIRRRACPLSDVFGLGVLAAFFLTPYARAYDLTVLIVPLIVLVGRLRPVWGMMLLVVCIVVPTAQLCLTATWGPEGREVMLCWPPLLLSLLWFLSCCQHVSVLSRPSLVLD
jgi:hypothetical protein